MPVPRLLEYSTIRVSSGFSGASTYIRSIYEPMMHISDVMLPDPSRPGLADRYEHRLAGRRFDAKFGTELRGRAAASAVDDPLPDGDLYHAVGFNGYGNTGANYVYALHDIHSYDSSAAGDLFPCDLGIIIDGINVGGGSDCAGNAVFRFPANDICTVEWEFAGVNGGGLVATAPPETTPAVTESVGDTVLGNNATISFTPAGGGAITTLCVRDMTIDLRNTVLLRPCIAQQFGFTKPVLPERNVTFSGVIEAPLLATADFDSLVTNRTIITAAITVGDVAKSIFTFAFKFTLNQMPDLTNIDGMLGYAFEGKMHPTGLLTITVT